MQRPVPYNTFRSSRPPTIPETVNYNHSEVSEYLKVNRLLADFVLINDTKFLLTSTPVTISEPNNVTYTASNILSGILTRNPQGTDRDDILPTSQDIINSINNPIQNNYFYLTYHNTSTTNIITLQANTGITIENNIKKIYPKQSVYLIFLLTNVFPGTEQITLYIVDNFYFDFPSNSVDTSIVRFNSTLNTIESSPVTINPAGNVGGVLAPLDQNDAANKIYVDQNISNIDWKKAVVCVTTANVTLSGTTLSANTDGVTPTNGDRILVISQTLPVQNGVYIYNSTGAWTRASDLPLGASAHNLSYGVIKGTLYENNSFICSTDPPNDIVGSNPLTYTLLSQIIQPGSGLTKSNDILNINIDNITMALKNNNLVSTIITVGTIIQHVSQTIPNYLLCDGSSYSRFDYAQLFEVLNTLLSEVTISIASPAVCTAPTHGLTTGQIVFFTTTDILPGNIIPDTSYWVKVLTPDTFNISSTYSNLLNNIYVNTTGGQSGTHSVYRSLGGVSSSTTFNVPDLRGRTVSGVGPSVGVGTITGIENQLMSIGYMPEHSHTYVEPLHTHNYSNIHESFTVDNTNNQINGVVFDAALNYWRNVQPGLPSNTYTTNFPTAASGTTSSTGNISPSLISIYQPTFFIYSHIKYNNDLL